MKMKLNIFTIGVLTFLFSCTYPNQKTNKSTLYIDSSEIDFNKKSIKQLEKRKQAENQDQLDSLRLLKVLKDAYKIANQKVNKDVFNDKYEVIIDSIPFNVEMSLGYHFTKSFPHLIIKVNEPSAVYIEIYSKKKNEFNKVVSHEQLKMEYLNDTIRDINGDGLKDFVVNWYGSNGCCLKAFSNVYLLRNDKYEFSDNFQFINPTFSPNEKIIRGICYGHPGETEMYKYKWNGEKIDTIEFVSFEKNNKGKKTGKIILSTDKPYGDNYKILKILNSVPIEYKSIEGYYWFAGHE